MKRKNIINDTDMITEESQLWGAASSLTAVNRKQTRTVPFREESQKASVFKHWHPAAVIQGRKRRKPEGS